MSAARAGGDTPATTANTNPSRILEGKRAQRSWFTAWLNADMMMILRPMDLLAEAEVYKLW